VRSAGFTGKENGIFLGTNARGCDFCWLAFVLTSVVVMFGLLVVIFFFVIFVHRFVML